MRNQVKATMMKYKIDQKVYERFANVRAYVDAIRYSLDQIDEIEPKLKELTNFIESSFYSSVEIPAIVREITNKEHNYLWKVKMTQQRQININLGYISEYKLEEEKEEEAVK